jgi:triosephosphate isomerase
MRQTLVAGNWKMNGSLEGNRQLLEGVMEGVASGCRVDVTVCPPAVYLSQVAELLTGSTITWGAQNLSHEQAGAFTGEISAEMLRDFRCQYVIVGHSERRALYAESDTLVAKKYVAAQTAGLIPILCVGELLKEREAGETETVVARQLDAVVEVAGMTGLGAGVIAYEPVWAIGTGKTVVAALTCLEAVEAGWQAALMAPTELLAEQHFQSFQGWLEPLGVPVGRLTGRRRGAGRAACLGALRDGTIPVAVGTQALFQDEVDFARLGLVIIDEQHRFGVHQRLALHEKGRRDGLHPHQLIMTATPIPRTLAMTAYADLDNSVIDELPPGRLPVRTVVVPDTRRDEVIERVRSACGAGRQAYWVCTLIEESEALQCRAAADTAAALSEALPKLRVGLVHGRLKDRDKVRIMGMFQNGDLDLLVATTVIEVGVDVPNAGLMIIENAERLGLAQLHQLRGRVGRGRRESSCVLLYHGTLSETARQRLAALRETHDGFEIARRDLDLRGPGEVLGTRQAGALQFHIADLARDRDLLPAVKQAATLLLERHPGHVAPLIRRWLGKGARYAQV